MLKSSKLVLPTAYAPPTSWMAFFLFHPNVKLEYWENFQRATIRNRCEIMTSQGIQQLSIPLVGGRSQGAINEVKISYAEDWPKQHLKALQTAYAKSPFYEFLDYELAAVLDKRYDTLWELNTALLHLFLDWLQVEITIKSTESYLGIPQPFVSKGFWSPRPLSSGNKYPQVFDNQQPFVGNLSVLDLFFNLGPNALEYLTKLFNQMDVRGEP
jgi:hypothetical protein